MAIKVVWAFAVLVLLGGLGMVFYARWQETQGPAGFLLGLLPLVGAAVWGVRHGRRRQREIDAEERASGRLPSDGPPQRRPS